MLLRACIKRMSLVELTYWCNNFSTMELTTLYIMILVITFVSDSFSREWKKENPNGRSESREGEYNTNGFLPPDVVSR